METIEKGCHWFFPLLTDGIDEKNMTDSDEENLKGQSSISALVRESIQNSLDVHDDSERPVVMEFRLGWIDNPKEKIPEFLKLRKHIVGSRDYILSKGYKKAPLYFDPMINYLDEHTERFPYLCVADYQTIGMDDSRFYAFRENGASFKPGRGAGGSYGIGKAAYFMASSIKTILVSSLYKNTSGEKNVVFQGITKLTTNMVDGVKYYNKGYYDHTKSNPIIDSTEIPEAFSRSEMGTSMFVMGVDDSPNARKSLFSEIVDSVLKNFWLAIYEEKLIVKINIAHEQGGVLTIDKEELDCVMKRYDEYDKKSDYSSPRPYYGAYTTAVKYSPTLEDASSVFFEKEHEEFGRIRLYLVKNDQKHDRIIKMRSPRMFVTQEKFPGKRGFNGVLLCDDKWNELLTYAEPPAHDSWEERRIHEKDIILQEEKEKALEALRLSKQFVRDCISEFFHEDKDNDVDFCGVKDLLYTDKDFGSNSRHKGNASSPEEGDPSFVEGDSGIATTKSIGINGEEPAKTRPISSVTSINQKKASPGDPQLLGRRRKKRKRKKTDIVHTRKKEGLDFPVTADKEGKEGRYREIFNVRASCYLPSDQNSSKLYTMVVIAPKKIEKAMVEITTGTALGTLEVPISYSDKGVVNQNRIQDIPLEEGSNIIRFKFADNISHSIKVATYEFK